MRANTLRDIWKRGDAAINGWLSIPSSFASEARLPGARLRFEHVIEPAGSGCRVTHRAELDGPLAFLYARPVRKGVERGLPDGVDRLAALAESDSRD